MSILHWLFRLIDDDVVLSFNRMSEALTQTTARGRVSKTLYAIYGPRVTWAKLALILVGPPSAVAIALPKPPSGQQEAWFLAFVLLWIFAFAGLYFYRYKLIGRAWRHDPTAKLNVRNLRG